MANNVTASHAWPQAIDNPPPWRTIARNHRKWSQHHRKYPRKRAKECMLRRDIFSQSHALLMRRFRAHRKESFLKILKIDSLPNRYCTLLQRYQASADFTRTRKLKFAIYTDNSMPPSDFLRFWTALSLNHGNHGRERERNQIRSLPSYKWRIDRRFDSLLPFH